MAIRSPIPAPTGVAHGSIGALLTRFFLGICERALFPVSDRWRLFPACSHRITGSLVPPFDMVQAQLTWFTNRCPPVW